MLGLGRVMHKQGGRSVIEDEQNNEAFNARVQLRYWYRRCATYGHLICVKCEALSLLSLFTSHRPPHQCSPRLQALYQRLLPLHPCRQFSIYYLSPKTRRRPKKARRRPVHYTLYFLRRFCFPTFAFFRLNNVPFQKAKELRYPPGGEAYIAL